MLNISLKPLRLAPIVISTLLGLISGSAFLWADLDRAWAIYLGGFLVTLTVAVATASVRCVREQVQRGQWWRGFSLGLATTFPATTLYLAAAALISVGIPHADVLLPNGVLVTSKPDLLKMAAPFYTSSSVLAMVTGPIFMLTSPFRSRYKYTLVKEHVYPNTRNASNLNRRLFVSRTDPYLAGSLDVRTIDVTAGQAGAPVSMQIHTPTEPGAYAVIVFQHGFLLANSFYSQILRHLASHGFVVVAPQMYDPACMPFGTPSTTLETYLAAQVLNWLPKNLSRQTGVTARADLLGLAGHSRGGKVAWRLLKQSDTRILAIAGIDPVDGNGGLLGSETRVIDGPFEFSRPSLVIGTDFGSVVPGPFAFACAPKGDNHEQFYTASSGPAWHIVALEHGHLDMLDEHPPGCGWACGACLRGRNKAGMRQLTGGLLAAFFRASLLGDTGLYGHMVNTRAVPIPIKVARK